ncbi:hypothetical protein BRD17_08740 [Halobacteriales archaeon SW_7_68_16]|nr:MAG: hypothetical protein BRD17_08740 [Halobacteriales archaeon SW_7_68_16]
MTAIVDPAAFSHPYTLIGIAAVLLSAISAGYVARLEHSRHARLFAYLAGLYTLGAAGALGEAVFQPFGLKTLSGTVLFVASTVAAPPLFCYFTLAYTDRTEWLTRPVLVALVGIPAVLFVVGITNRLHGLYATPIRLVDAGGLRAGDSELRIGGQLQVLYIYVVDGFGVGLLAAHYRRHRGSLRQQGLPLVVGGVLSLAVGLVGLFDLHPYPAIDIGAFGFAVSAPFFLWSLYDHDLFDIVPVAHRRVVEGMDDGVAVVDTGGLILDVNERLAAIVGVDREAVVGEPAAAVFGEVEGFDRAIPGSADPADEIAVDRDGGTRYFAVRQSTIRDGRDDRVGTVTVYSDVTERKRRERQLIRQNERLDRFADTIAHDLRSPLSVARAYATQLDGGNDEDVEKVTTSLDRMNRMIDDILAMARNGETVTDPESVSLAAVARQAHESLDTTAATVEVETDRVVACDPDRLQRLFENCFRNAVEHSSTGNRTRSGDAVEHSPTGSQTGSGDAVEHTSTGNRTESGDAVEHDHEGVRITVVADAGGFRIDDDGPGIPDDDRNRVFDSGYTTSAEGTGFGLSIVENIAHAHGWTVSVGESPTGGASIRVRTDGSGAEGETEGEAQVRA